MNSHCPEYSVALSSPEKTAEFLSLLEKDREHLLSLFRRNEPNFKTFEDVTSEEFSGKRSLLAKIRSFLADHPIDENLTYEGAKEIVREFGKAAGKWNFVHWTSWDSLEDPAECLVPNLIQLYQFAHGEIELEELFESLQKGNEKIGWAVLFFIFWIFNPKAFFPVKPSVIRNLMNRRGATMKKRQAPDVELFREMMSVGVAFWKFLEGYQPKDWVDVQSFMWICHQVETEQE